MRDEDPRLIRLEVVNDGPVQEEAQDVRGRLKVVVERVVEELEPEHERVPDALRGALGVLGCPCEEWGNWGLRVRVKTRTQVLNFLFPTPQRSEMGEVESYFKGLGGSESGNIDVVDYLLRGRVFGIGRVPEVPGPSVPIGIVQSEYRTHNLVR